MSDPFQSLPSGGSFSTKPAVVTPCNEDHDSNNNNSSGSEQQQQQQLPAIIKLNVGGCLFTSCRTTLCRVAGSVLEAMFSGRHAIQQDEHGCVFIDRDGTNFRHILNFLRVGSVTTLPKEEEEKENLAVEADYYGLEAMVKAIRMPMMDVTDFLTEESLQHREQETKLRKKFAAGNGAAMDPFAGLVSLFDTENGVIDSLPLMFDQKKAAATIKKAGGNGALFMGSLRNNPKTDDPLPVTVKNIYEFRTNFNREWANILPRIQPILREENVIMAGGSVLRALTASKGVRTSEWWNGNNWSTKASDIDLFLHCKNSTNPEEEATRIARRIFYSLVSSDNEKWIVIRCAGVINIHRVQDDPHIAVEVQVQIVLRLYDSPSEILAGFDCDSCTCAFDGDNVWVAPRFLTALQTGINILNPLHALPNKPSYEFRLAKYANRGFATLLPGLDENRLDRRKIDQTELKDLKGLARLLKISTASESAPPITRDHWVRPEGGGRAQRVTTSRPPHPREIPLLRNDFKALLPPDQRLITVAVDWNDLYDSSNDAIVPPVFGEGSPLEWVYNDVPLARDSRDEAWQHIEDAGDDDDRSEYLKRRLDDAWHSEKRSREYLNDEVDKFLLDHTYYAEAYKQGGEDDDVQ